MVKFAVGNISCIFKKIHRKGLSFQLWCTHEWRMSSMQLCRGSSTRALQLAPQGQAKSLSPQNFFSWKDVGEFIAASSASSGLPHGWEAGLHGYGPGKGSQAQDVQTKAREAFTAQVRHEQIAAMPEPFRALCCLSSFMHLHGGALRGRWGCVLPQPCLRQGKSQTFKG